MHMRWTTDLFTVNDESRQLLAEEAHRRYNRDRHLQQVAEIHSLIIIFSGLPVSVAFVPCDTYFFYKTP